LLDNSPTNQLADWSTRRQRCFNHGKMIIYLYTKQNLALALTLSTIESVQWRILPQTTFIAIIYCTF